MTRFISFAPTANSSAFTSPSIARRQDASRFGANALEESQLRQDIQTDMARLKRVADPLDTVVVRGPYEAESTPNSRTRNTLLWTLGMLGSGIGALASGFIGFQTVTQPKEPITPTVEAFNQHLEQPWKDLATASQQQDRDAFQTRVNLFVQATARALQSSDDPTEATFGNQLLPSVHFDGAVRANMEKFSAYAGAFSRFMAQDFRQEIPASQALLNSRQLPKRFVAEHPELKTLPEDAQTRLVEALNQTLASDAFWEQLTTGGGWAFIDNAVRKPFISLLTPPIEGVPLEEFENVHSEADAKRVLVAVLNQDDRFQSLCGGYEPSGNCQEAVLKAFDRVTAAIDPHDRDWGLMVGVFTLMLVTGLAGKASHDKAGGVIGGAEALGHLLSGDTPRVLDIFARPEDSPQALRSAQTTVWTRASEMSQLLSYCYELFPAEMQEATGQAKASTPEALVQSYLNRLAQASLNKTPGTDAHRSYLELHQELGEQMTRAFEQGEFIPHTIDRGTEEHPTPIGVAFQLYRALVQQESALELGQSAGSAVRNTYQKTLQAQERLSRQIQQLQEQAVENLRLGQEARARDLAQQTVARRNELKTSQQQLQTLLPGLQRLEQALDQKDGQLEQLRRRAEQAVETARSTSLQDGLLALQEKLAATNDRLEQLEFEVTTKEVQNALAAGDALTYFIEESGDQPLLDQFHALERDLGYEPVRLGTASRET
ncbi:MAG: hypothetical protein SFZ03_09800 [Candidatus Melainabacteria bacterium]|nr:hypothetical protein [Candidatus Melainabacteria bacterium]